MSAPVIIYVKNILKKIGCLYGSKLIFGYTNRKIHVCIHTCWIIWLVEKLWNVKINSVVLKTDCPYILNKYGWWKLLKLLEYTLLKHLNPAAFVYLQCLALCFTLGCLMLDFSNQNPPTSTSVPESRQNSRQPAKDLNLKFKISKKISFISFLTYKQIVSIK